MDIESKDFVESWNSVIDKLSDWMHTLIINIPNMVIALIVFTVALVVAKYTNKILKQVLLKTSLQLSLRKVLGRLTTFIIVGLAIFLILGILNLDKALNAILAGAGVMGLAVGLALQGALSNTYSGIVLSYIKNIKNGDWIETNGFSGEIIDVDFRALTLRQRDNNLVYIPNKMVIENAVKNFSSTPVSRVILQNSVAYDSDLEKVKEITTDLIINNFEVPKSKEDVLFLYKEFGKSAITYELRFWINSFSALEVAKAKSKAIMLIKEAYHKSEIEIPFPMRTLEFKNELHKII